MLEEAEAQGAEVAWTVTVPTSNAVGGSRRVVVGADTTVVVVLTRFRVIRTAYAVAPGTAVHFTQRSVLVRRSQDSTGAVS